MPEKCTQSPLFSLKKIICAREGHLCKGCDLELAFLLSSGKQEITLGVEQILDLLKTVQEQDLVPPLDQKWWAEVINQHG